MLKIFSPLNPIIGCFRFSLLFFYWKSDFFLLNLFLIVSICYFTLFLIPLCVCIWIINKPFFLLCLYFALLKKNKHFSSFASEYAHVVPLSLLLFPTNSGLKKYNLTLAVLQWCWMLILILTSLFLALPLPFPFVRIAVVLSQPHKGDSVPWICHQFIILVLFFSSVISNQ